MPKETAPVLEIDFELTEKEYVRAALLLSRRVGVLRSLPAVVILALLLLTAGMLAFGWFPGYPLIPLILCLCCPLLLLLFFVVEPAGVCGRRKRIMKLITLSWSPPGCSCIRTMWSPSPRP